jgi:hypothetical protein
VRHLSKAWLAAFIAALAAAGVAAAAAPTPPPLVHYPKKAAHTAFVIEVNKTGQVTKVRSRTNSGDHVYDSMVLGNVVQTFVRKPDGTAVAGVYRMRYDYNPKTKSVRRTVELIHAGGVNPDAVGLVDRMAEVNRRSSEALRKAEEARTKPIKGVPLPFLSPSPRPAASP